MSRGREEERKTRQDKRWCRTKGWQSWRNVSWSVRQNGELHCIDQNVYLPPQCVEQRGAQDVRLVLEKYGLDEDLLGLDGNVDVFQLGFSIVEVGLDVTRHVSRPITSLEVLAEKNWIMFVYNLSEILENGPYQMNKNIDINTNTNSNTFTKKIDVIVKGKGSL